MYPLPPLRSSPQALKLYEQLHAAIPNIRPLSQSAPVPQGQEYENLLRLAQDGIAAVTGQQVPDPIPKPSSTAPSRSGSINAPAKRAHGGKDKAPTKCLGCGATETPEWRRGPLGPRTLCNACVGFFGRDIETALTRRDWYI